MHGIPFWRFEGLRGQTLGGLPLIDRKSIAVGVLTIIRISKAHGVLAEFSVAHQAFEKINRNNLGNLANIWVWQFTKVFHERIVTNM
jgi:hypothetical protein